METLDDSTNSKSRIFFTTLGGRVAVGLNGHAASSEFPVGASIAGSGSLGGVAAEAAVVSSSSPDVDGVKMGGLERAESEVVME